ncbi:hypothetical protein KSF_049130 [Reticulibacter mediterranei]|uniref:Uncharacterized protein n=1 Tax=Reticulibacter mediterranei TaxID=2778369 RepID=A0A8J3ILY3_9CHLR|nr:hypothetical protein KSF_049130 [Reticulibacter mediterranei]
MLDRNERSRFYAYSSENCPKRTFSLPEPEGDAEEQVALLVRLFFPVLSKGNVLTLSSDPR